MSSVEDINLLVERLRKAGIDSRVQIHSGRGPVDADKQVTVHLSLEDFPQLLTVLERYNKLW